MATYVIGDVQGCASALKRLLEVVQFDPTNDQLGFVGDLINRGPESLETLRFIKSLPNTIITLGNHDLFALGLGYGTIKTHEHNTLDNLLDAPDKIELLDWLRQQPLAHFYEQHNTLMVHAGIPPQWSRDEALQHAANVSNTLRSDAFLDFLKQLEGNTNDWNKTKNHTDRLRYIVNALTRMRFCTENGVLDLNNKSKQSTDKTLKPWYCFRNDDFYIAHGHWAALEGKNTNPNCFAIDTGCVYGGKLTALRLDDFKRFTVQCSREF